MSWEKKKPDLGGYVQVNERIKQFYTKYPDGRLVTASVQASTEPDGKPRIWVEALAYRTADDPLPTHGYSWMELPGATNFTRGSELENTETSAWGRAIGALGIGIDKSIASSDEIAGKERGPEAEVTQGFEHQDGSLIGVAQQGKSDADFELRQTNEGYRLAFRLVEGRKGIKVEAWRGLAELIAEYRAGIEGQRVTCWGDLVDKTFTPKATDAQPNPKPVTYQVLTLSRIKAGALDFTEPEPPDEQTPDELTDELAQLAFPVPA